jgi:hypothetical protein
MVSQMVATNDLTDEQKTFIWAQGALRQMKIWGLIGGPDWLTPKGIGLWDQLDAEWKPTDVALAHFSRWATKGDDEQAMFKMLQDFRDNRERMQSWCEEKPRAG